MLYIYIFILFFFFTNNKTRPRNEKVKKKTKNLTPWHFHKVSFPDQTSQKKLSFFVLLLDDEEGKEGETKEIIWADESQLTQYRGRSGVGELRLKRMTLWVCVFRGLARWIDGKKHNIWTNKDEEVEHDQNPQQTLAAGAAAGAWQGWWPLRWRSNGRGGVVGGT